MSQINFVKRYTDAYRTAKAISVVGNITKVIGIIVAGLIVLSSIITTAISFDAANQANLAMGNPTNFGGDAGGRVAGIILIAGAVWGFLIGFVFFVFGTLLSASGQMLQATLDATVEASPRLSDDEKLVVMK